MHTEPEAIPRRSTRLESYLALIASWVDALIGARFRAPLGSRVAFIGRGDVAGFGSKVTWNVEGDLSARVSQHRSVGAGWRHMSIDYDKAVTERHLFNLKFAGPRAWASYAW